MTDLRRAVASSDDRASAAEPARVGWRLPLLATLAALVAWGVLFWEEAVHAVHIWETSASYNHGWLILPIALWLAWERRHRLALLAPRPSILLAALGLPAALMWLLAERLGVMEGRQFAALGVVYAIVLGAMGWRIGLAMAAPLVYLVFLVPFGAFTVPALQTVTARMVDIGLDWTGIPHYVDDLLIDIPEGSFYVAEACAGLRFIIAALAFGALYAFVMFRSPWRRLTVMVLALVVPIIANGLRALGLVVIGHIQGSAAAVAADHVIYGWGFFSVVLLLLIAAGLPFREDRAPPKPLTGPDAGAPRAAVAAAAAVLVALAPAAGAAAVTARLDAGAAALLPREEAVPLRAADYCEARPDGALLCDGVRVTARLVLFPPGVNWDAVASMRRQLTLSVSDEDVTFSVPGGAFRARQPSGQTGTIAVAAWLDGQVAGDGLRSRARQALHALRGGQPGGPVLAVVELQPEGGARDGQRDRGILTRVLDAQRDGLIRRAEALSRER
jgi:exosortase A